MFCKKCNNPLSENVEFCRKCGTPVSSEEIDDEVITNNLQNNTVSSGEEYAGFWIRLGAFAIDYVLVAFIIFLLVLFDIDFTEGWDDSIAGLFIIIVYHTISLAYKSTTIGKKVFGLRVIDINTNGKVKFGKALGRSLSYIASSFFFGIGFIVAAFNKKKRAWHDQIAGTVVIRDKRTNITLGIILSVAAIIISAVLVYYAYLPEDDTSLLPAESESQKEGVDVSGQRKEKGLSEEILSSVVNIVCEYADGSDATGGSGTILNSEGLIITNSHIIPQDKYSLNTSEIGCIITLPDTETGALKEVYLADPIVFDQLSDDYDLAFLEIYDVYTDDEGYQYGQYPNTFPAFDDSERCTEEGVKLGEKIKVLGYPGSTGGFNLTVTEGIVSSISEDGYILTSAKIDQGNSGGLAIDNNGCMIGIPSAVSIGEYENMGVIIPVDTISEFADKVLTTIDQ